MLPPARATSPERVRMAGFFPEFTLWGIVDYVVFFTTFGVMFTIMNAIFMVIGDDIEAKWGRSQ